MRHTDALTPLVRKLPTRDPDTDARWSCTPLTDGVRLIVTTDAVDRAALREITAGCDIPAFTIVSRSGTTGYRAMLVAPRGRVGLDVETIGRITVNTKVTDLWIGAGERATIGRSDDPVLERACCWVLKEAYGKALGVGLALSLDALNFSGKGGTIVVTGAAAPMQDEGWRFGLYRRDDMLFGLAYR